MPRIAIIQTEGKQMIKTLVFDIGNVLVNWYPLEYLKSLTDDSENAAELEKKIFGGPEWQKGDLGEFTREQTREALLRRYPQDREIICKALDGADDILTASEGNTLLLSELRDAGFELYYLSNTNPSAFEYMLAKHKFFDYFSGGIASYKVGLLKPDPKIFEAFLKKYGKIAEECIFIDDTRSNTDSAASCGFFTVTLGNIPALRGELMKFDDIAKAMKGV